MMSSLPKLRSDLTVSRQQTANGPIFVLKHPVSGEFFRFREAEQFIAEQLDGETPLDLVRRRTEEKFGATLPAESLTAFIRNLQKSGLLETEDTAKKEGSGERGRIRGSLLYLRFPLFDPDPLFNRLVRRVRFLFTPHFLAFSAALILLAVGITVAHWSEYTQDLSRLYRLSVIPLLLVVAFVVVSAHEFAHGLTCKHFGGQVHEIGFMLIYFQPAFYTNVSDAWLFPEKSKRLWVGFAGAYFEMFLWALATVVWRLTDVETWANYLALIVMTLSGVKTLLNFNPFIKLDGYYLLSDYLELPNLRRKSFRYVGGWLQRLFGWEPQTAQELSPREHRIYLSYGLVAAVSSCLLLGYVLVATGGFLIEIGQPTVLFLLTGLVGLKVRHRFRKLFGKPSGASDPSDDGDDFETSNPEASRAAAPPRKKRRHSWKRRIKWAALTGATLAVLFLGRLELRIAGPFNVLPEENADVRAAVGGIVEEVYVDEGDEVRAGDVIARLSDAPFLNDLDRIEARIREARANLKKLEAGPTAAEIAVAQAAVAKAEDQLKYARGRVKRFRQLLEENLTSRNDFGEAQHLAVMAENDLVEAQSRLNVLVSGTRPEEIEATRAQLDRLETERHFLQAQLGVLTLVSPTTGVVATPSRQLKEMRGQFVGAGALIAKVYEFSTMTAQIMVSEKEIADIQVGQQVVLRARAYPDKAFQGTVTFIATSAQASSGSGPQTPLGAAISTNTASANKTILVSTEIDNRSLLLKPEMTGQAKIFCGQRRILDLVTRRVARTFKVEFWSWW